MHFTLFYTLWHKKYLKNISHILRTQNTSYIIMTFQTQSEPALHKSCLIGLWPLTVSSTSLWWEDETYITYILLFPRRFPSLLTADAAARHSQHRPSVLPGQVPRPPARHSDQCERCQAEAVQAWLWRPGSDRQEDSHHGLATEAGHSRPSLQVGAGDRLTIDKFFIKKST